MISSESRGWIELEIYFALLRSTSLKYLSMASVAPVDACCASGTSCVYSGQDGFARVYIS